jgi:hypothetical protein
MKNQYDTLVIELQKDGTSVGSASIKKIDLDMLMNMHGHSRSSVISDMIEAIENKGEVNADKSGE